MTIETKLNTPLLSNDFELLPFSELDRDCYLSKLIHRQFFCREETVGISKAATLAEKTLAISIGVLGKYPSIAPALLLAKGNKTLEVLYTFGVTSLMVQDSWCMDKLLYERLVSKKTEETIITRSSQKKLLKVIQNLGISTFAMVSVCPDAYISYFYNHKSYIWLTLSFISSLGFPMVSLKELVEKVLKSLPSAGLNRTPSLKDKNEITKVRKGYLRAVSKVQKKLLTMSKLEKQIKLSEIFISEHTSYHYTRVKRLIKQVMAIEEKNTDKKKKNCPLAEISLEVAGVTGIAAATFSYVLVATVMGDFLKTFITTDRALQAMLISACILPKSFLTIASTRKVFRESMDTLIQSKSKSRQDSPSIATKYKPKITKGLKITSVGAVVLGMAPTVEVVKDNFDQNSLFGKMLMGSVLVTGISLGGMMVTDFVDQIMREFIKQTGTDEQKDLIDWAERFEHLEAVIEKSSDEEFVKFLEFMDEEEPDSQSLQKFWYI